MKKITYVEVDKQTFQWFAEEHIKGLLLPTSGFTSASVGDVAAKEEQTPHRHHRPKDGDELIFVYEGLFELVTETAKTRFDVDRDGPVFISVPSGMQASINNLGTKRVRFFSVFAPPFQVGEINYLKTPVS